MNKGLSTGSVNRNAQSSVKQGQEAKEMLSSQQEVNMFLKRRESRKAVEKMKATQEGRGFPGSASGKPPAASAGDIRRPGFDPWVGKIPWRRAWTQESGRPQSTETQGARHD